MFNKVKATVLFVEDFDTCLRFYRDILGLKVGILEATFAAFEMDEQNFVVQGIAAAEKIINVPVAAFEAETGKIDRVMLCAQVEDVDEAYETLKAKGVEFTQPPIDQPWGLRGVYFRDPEGNVWEFYHPLAS